MIKPDAVGAGNSGKIIDQIIAAGFKIKAMKLTRLDEDKAGQFYGVHKGKGFYDELVEFMVSGNIIPMILEKENAVEDYRKLIGATNHLEAAEGTIRKQFATDLTQNAVHGADSDENAEIEGSFFFSAFERF